MSYSEVPSCPQCNSNDLKKMPTTFASKTAISRFEIGATDLPSMKEFHQKKDKPPKKLDKNKIFKDF